MQYSAMKSGSYTMFKVEFIPMRINFTAVLYGNFVEKAIQ